MKSHESKLASFLVSSAKKVKAFPTVKEVLQKHKAVDLAGFIQFLVDEEKISLAEFESYLIPDDDEDS